MAKFKSSSEAETTSTPLPLQNPNGLSHRPASVEFPLDQPTLGYMGRHVDVQLDARAQRALRSLVAGLDSARELVPGSQRRVQGGTDAVRWLLNKVADQADKLFPEAKANPA